MLTSGLHTRRQMFGGMPGYIRNMKRPPVVDEQPLPPIPGMAGQAPPKLNADFDSLMTQLGGQAPAQAPRMANAAPQGLMAQGKPAHQSGPSKGLLGSETFQKPDMTLSDKIGLISGMLMDYDGTMGSGNADKFRGMYDERVDEARGTFEEQRQQKLMEAAAGGDMNAMFMLDPSLALGERRDRRDFRYGVGRDEVADEQFERGWKRVEGRYETEQERFARLDALEAELGRGNLGVSRMNAETSRMGVNNDAAARQAEAQQQGAGLAPALVGLPSGVQGSIVGNDLKNIDAITEATDISSTLVTLAEEWLRQADGYGAQGGGFLADIGQAFSQKTNPLKGLTEQMVMLQKKPGTGTMTDDDAVRAQKATLNINQGADANKQVLRIYQAMDQNNQQHQAWLREAQATYGFGSGGMAQQAWLEYSRANPVYDKETGEPIMNRTPIREWLAALQSPATDAPAQVRTDEDYDALPSGAIYAGPDGIRRTKP